MVTESPIKMLSEMGMRPVIGGGDGFNGDDLEKELSLLFRDQCRQEASDRERELNLYRSGSAPPTVEGSLTAVGGLFGGDGAGLSDFTKSENGFLSEEQLRSDPAYPSYYYSHVNLNPRLPPPVLSKEDWRLAQRLQAGNSALGGIGDRRKANQVDEGGSRSLFSLQPGFNSQKKEGAGEWLNNGGDGLIGLSGLALGGKQKSFAEIFEDDLGHTAPVSRHPSRPSSRSTFDDNAETFGTSEMQLVRLHHEVASDVRGGGKVQSVAGPVGTSASHTFASVLGGSLSRSTTPDPQLVGRSPSPCLPPVGARIGATDKIFSNGSNSFNGIPSSFADSADIVGAFSGMNLSRNGMVEEDSYVQSNLQREIEDHQNRLFYVQGGKKPNEENHYLRKSDSGHFDLPAIPNSAKSSYPDFGKFNGSATELSSSILMPEGQVDLQRPNFSSSSSYLKVPSVTSPGCSPTHYQDNAYAAYTSYGLNGCSINPALPPMMANHIGASNLPPLFENAAAVSGIVSPVMEPRVLGGGLVPSLSGSAELQNLSMTGNHTVAAALQMPLMDPLYIQHLRAAEYAAQVAANFNTTSMDRNYIGNMGNSYVELLELQKAYLGTLLSSQKQYGMPSLGKSGGLNHNYYGNPSLGLGMLYPGSPLASPVVPASPVGPGTPLRHGERNFRFTSGMGNLGGAVMGAWHSDTGGNMDEGFASSLLEEFKGNKTRCFELCEIASHVVEFSADQYGSRFIQQKLETASTEEKNMVFEEIIPQALSLMTDVFGNYVIQKFFEHGTAAQRRELANQLTGHVLTLSLQMYGCRVIQKAIEVVDLDQQTKMVAELDGHIMRCVRDQNGNHVIQKCIECIPQDAIHFIISSFYDQVVALSTHPYGCRVIQRVLEHCDDPKTQQIMMDEIFLCVCMLAQDQYGNYVVQHVLEHGKPHERSAIIKKLAGQIVQMSQQKFASNVVEKCLTFGGPAERQILVNEMLGSTDENEPLQAMMKDQFANYVVQKVLETCDDQQRELILSRIKVHLNALKKYTYGKHIVARVEKLVAAGGVVKNDDSQVEKVERILIKLGKELSEYYIHGEVADTRKENWSSILIPDLDGVGREVVQLTEARMSSTSSVSIWTGTG